MKSCKELTIRSLDGVVERFFSNKERLQKKKLLKKCGQHVETDRQILATRFDCFFLNIADGFFEFIAICHHRHRRDHDDHHRPHQPFSFFFSFLFRLSAAGDNEKRERERAERKGVGLRRCWEG